MDAHVREVLETAQALPASAQVELIEALIASLDELRLEPLDQAWLAEIERRSAAYDAGLERTLPWSKVLNQ